MTIQLNKVLADSPIGDRVEGREYDLIAPNGTIILDHEWEAVIEPGMAVTMRMWADLDTVREDIETSNRGKVMSTYGQLEDPRLRWDEPYYDYDRTILDKSSFPIPVAAKKGQSKDYYNILEISKDASDLDIRKSFRKMTIKHHPDRNRGATVAKFNEIIEAYEVLSNPQYVHAQTLFAFDKRRTI